MSKSTINEVANDIKWLIELTEKQGERIDKVNSKANWNRAALYGIAGILTGMGILSGEEIVNALSMLPLIGG